VGRPLLIPYAPTRKGRAASARDSRNREVDGPYRSQSSVPSIRHAATRHEHRAPGNPFDHVDVDHAVGPAPFHIAPLADLTTTAAASHVAAAAPTPAIAQLASLLKLPTSAETPEQALMEAELHGREPPRVLEHTFGRDYPHRPELYDKIVRVARQELASKEGIHADPEAELAINLLATAGIGAGANLLKGGGELALAGAEGGAAASEGESAAGVLSRLRSAPSALRAGAESLTSRAGQRAAAERVAQGAAGKAIEHPYQSQAGLLALAHTAGIHGGGTGIPYALLAGHAKALIHPGKTIPTTARALAGIVAAPAAVGYSAVDSALSGSPQPLLNTLTGQGEGLVDIGKHLLSGDPAEVQKAVEDEAGLSFLVPLPALTRGERYQRLRSGVRDVAARAREDLADKYGLPTRVGPGEQKVSGFAQRRGERRDVAHMTSDVTLPERVRAAQYEKPIIREARKIPGARSLRNLHGLEGGDLIQTFADYGITSPHQLELLRERGPVSSVEARPGDINLRAVLDFADQHPEIVGSPHLYKAVQHYRDQTEQLPANLAGHGKRAAALPQAQLFGIRDAVDRVPHAARAFTKAEDRTAAWHDLRSSEKRAKDLRHKGRTEAVRYAENRRLGDHEEAAIARSASEHHYAEARKLEERNRDLRKALTPYSRPGAAVSSRARRKLFDKPLVDEMVSETNAAAAEHGLVPGVYTHHAPLRQEGTVPQEVRFGNAATHVQHVRRADEFSLAATDTVDRSLRGLLAGSVEGPRIRAGGQALARKFFSKFSTPIDVAGTTKRRVTQGEFAQAIRDGQVSESHYVWVPEAQYKQAYVDPNVSPERYAEEAHATLRGEILAGGKGAKGVIVPKEAFKEYAAQINPTRTVADRFVNALSKGAGRVLLFSPAWVESQMIAEGLPIVMSNPRLLNPAYIAKLDRRLKEFNDVSPNEAMGFSAVMGEAPVRAATPNELRPFQSSKAHQLFYDGARAVEHNPIGRVLFSMARLRPFVLFDQWRHGKYQKILAAAEVDRRLNGFMSNLQGALIHEKKLSEELKGMDPVDQLHALTQPRYAKDLEKIKGYVEGITGNWTAFTRFERFFSPAAVFYGFIRYAFRWPLTFAKEHPVSATINYFLAQQNANQVEKLLHGKPTDFYKYANPVVQNAQGQSEWLPGGARIAPGLSAPSQAVLGANAPAAAVGSLNPAYAALLGLITGTDSFGGHDENEGALGLHWSLAAKELMSLPPIARYLGLGESHSETAEALHHNDPHRKTRSLVAPWLPQSGAGALASEETIRSIEAEDSGGSSSSSGNPFDEVSPLGESSNPFDKVELP
jgi:hypothetical protein